tara:strand:+ start:679 stop:1059 length:381 start_codon:yes stop_codon:yes gene_type:complete
MVRVYFSDRHLVATELVATFVNEADYDELRPLLLSIAKKNRQIVTESVDDDDINDLSLLTTSQISAIKRLVMDTDWVDDLNGGENWYGEVMHDFATSVSIEYQKRFNITDPDDNDWSSDDEVYPTL